MTLEPPLQGTLVLDKRALRVAMKRTLAGLSDEQRRRGGEAVAAHLAPLLDDVAARRPGALVALFASLPHEIATGPVDEALRGRGLRRATPALVAGELQFRRVDDRVGLQDLPRDPFGIPTPPDDAAVVDLAAAALILTPGLAFDERGGRLGYGKGYYDRAIGRVRAQAVPGEAAPPAVALLLDEQIVPRVPTGDEDETLDGLCAPALGLKLRCAPPG